MALVWVATAPISVSPNVRAFNRNDIVPDSVVEALDLEGTGLIVQREVTLPSGLPSRGVDPVTQDELDALVVGTGRLSAEALRAAFAPGGADGIIKPTALPIPRQPIRLAQYRVAAEKPLIRATNNPDPASNYRDVPFDGDPSSPFAYWGATAWRSDAYGLSGHWGAANPGGTWAPPWDTEFVSDSPLLALRATSGGAFLQVFCNDEVIYEGSAAPSGGSWIEFNWNGTRRLRRYRFRGYLGIHSLRVGAADSVFAPPVGDLGPLSVWVTDSYGQQGGRRAFDSYPRTASAMLGWRCAQNTDGGTGYAQDAGDGSTQTFLERVPQIAATDPNLVVWAGGHNISAGEIANGYTGLRASAAAVFNATRDSLGDVPMWALGPLSNGTTFQTAHNAAWDQLALACADYDVTFVDTRGWVTGTGFEGSPANDGNADVLVSPDATHYNAYGTEYVAARIAQAIAATL